MRFSSVAAAAAALLTISMSTASAQGAPADPQCLAAGVPVAARDACQQAVDLFKYMMPQLGTSIVGGNPTQAQGGSLGGLPHFTFGIRGNVIMGSVPELQTPSTTGIQQRANYPTNDQILGLPAVDASIGLFKGLPLALSNVGGVDLLLSAAYVPNYKADEVEVTPKTNIQIGYGARVGLLQESLLIPGIGVSYMKRDLPTTTIAGVINSDSLIVQDLDVKTTAWRVTASKSLVLFTLAVGAGQDTYDASTAVRAATSFGNAGPITVSQKMTRTNYFADLSMNILLVKIVGSVGMVSGGDVPTHNTFSTAADASRMYGSVGIRFGF
jgi:hypothetical protein